ncbi:hypothetical protein GBAR_LOCUS19746 [Geodia barretti]|uniref:Uncharacterized protein n=1 Tax=Geodia barretti TaxID=519541 RepID=A0AA35STP6_GEOBA|nr:hypothetical protein GBAR_LOCUS19746 [Geodia barretti]
MKDEHEKRKRRAIARAERKRNSFGSVRRPMRTNRAGPGQPREQDEVTGERFGPGRGKGNRQYGKAEGCRDESRGAGTREQRPTKGNRTD